MKFEMIETDVNRLRDPFVLLENGTYYMYGTGWICYKSNGDLAHWTKSEKELVVKPQECDRDMWAPEVHKYKGKYYMFTTYYSSKTNHRGCTILRSDMPDGPFTEITNGHITPSEWDSIDGTFYVDEEDQPWMVFVHEWTGTDDHVGRMAAAKLSEDLTRFISKPIELFRADAPAWAKDRITDGCFMYKTADGQLLMLWSNFDKEGYCVGIARSQTGKIDGEWIQDEKLLFSKEISGEYDGGHPMLFADVNGQLYLSIHSPNSPIGARMEKPVLIAVCEKDSTIVIQ